MKITTWEEADRAMEQLAEAKAQYCQLVALLESEKAHLAQSFGERVSKAEGECSALTGDLERWAKSRKKEFKPREEGGAVRSYEHADVTIGFRLGTPQVRIENEEYALAFLDEFEGGVYVRNKKEPNRETLRDALLNDDERTEEKLALHGITLQQKDRVFVEVKSDGD